MSSPPRLTQYRLCPRSRSIRLALAEYGTEIALLDENPWEWRKDFLAKNPAGEMPVLEYDGGPTLCGAYSISEYIAEEVMPPSRATATRPPPLFPGNREGRAEVRRLVDWYHGKFDREVSRELLNEKVYETMRPTHGSPDPSILRTVRTNLRYHLAYTGYLADARRWLAGDDLSFADFAAAAHISVVDYLGEMPWNEYPAVKIWYQRIKSRPSFRALLADRVPGSAPSAVYSDLDF
ncbi:glutathione S-transferase family protein [Hyphomicrobium methylovorum]|uniref:glutathione S-transferase family protein n=1 Tax=Hyphomicrobium methylovorum TaxID=84 RepID=UPI0015E7C76B|nr:glutathione S-transferase family protein [Hyphomicrobium methylovorum]MBA2125624.1 glutathione S-transferase family protein [Hyphomicrobium methylovorum]